MFTKETATETASQITDERYQEMTALPKFKRLKLATDERDAYVARIWLASVANSEKRQKAKDARKNPPRSMRSLKTSKARHQQPTLQPQDAGCSCGNYSGDRVSCVSGKRRYDDMADVSSWNEKAGAVS